MPFFVDTWLSVCCVLVFLCVWIGIRYKRENECFTKSISLQCKNDTFIISKQLWIYIIFHIASWFFFYSLSSVFVPEGWRWVFSVRVCWKKIPDALFSSMNAVEWWCFFLCIDVLIPGYLIYNKLHYLFCSIKIMLSIFSLGCVRCMHSYCIKLTHRNRGRGNCMNRLSKNIKLPFV